MKAVPSTFKAGYFAYMDVCVPQVGLVAIDARRRCEFPLEMELPVVMSHHEDVRNQTLIICRARALNQCAIPLPHPTPIFLRPSLLFSVAIDSRTS